MIKTVVDEIYLSKFWYILLYAVGENNLDRTDVDRRIGDDSLKLIQSFILLFNITDTVNATNEYQWVRFSNDFFATEQLF